MNPCRDVTDEEVQTQLGEVTSSLFTDTTSTCYLTIYGDEGWPMYPGDDEPEVRRNLGRSWSMSQTKLTITAGTFGAVTEPVFTKDRNAEDAASQFVCYDGLSFSLSNPCKSWGEDACEDEPARRQLRRGGDRGSRPEPENFVQAQFAYDKWDEPVELTCTTYLKAEGEGDDQVCVASEFSCSGMYGSRDAEDEPSGKVQVTCRSEDWDMRYWEDAIECDDSGSDAAVTLELP